MKGNFAEWVRWILTGIVIPLGLWTINLRETVALQARDLTTLRESFEAHVLSDGQRIEKLDDRGQAQNETLIKANSALTNLKERLDDLLESLRSNRRRGG
jgi:hypothetical protein